MHEYSNNISREDLNELIRMGMEQYQPSYTSIPSAVTNIAQPVPPPMATMPDDEDEDEEYNNQCAFEPKSKEDEFFNALANSNNAINIFPTSYSDNLLTSELTLEFESTEQCDMHGFITNLCNYKFMLRSSEREARVLEVEKVISATAEHNADNYTEDCKIVFKYKDTTNEL